MRKVEKQYRPLVKKAVSCGWTLDQGTKHPVLISPKGLRLTLPGSSKNIHTYKWFIIQLRRNGVEV